MRRDDDQKRFQERRQKREHQKTIANNTVGTAVSAVDVETARIGLASAFEAAELEFSRCGDSKNMPDAIQQGALRAIELERLRYEHARSRWEAQQSAKNTRFSQRVVKWQVAIAAAILITAALQAWNIFRPKPPVPCDCKCITAVPKVAAKP
jgi:hypothetical protein